MYEWGRLLEESALCRTNLVLTTYYLLPLATPLASVLTTDYLLLTTDYLLRTAYYLLLTTYYLLLTTYYSLLTTYYLLLTTYYLLHLAVPLALLFTTFYSLLTTDYLLPLAAPLPAPPLQPNPTPPIQIQCGGPDTPPISTPEWLRPKGTVRLRVTLK